MVSTGICGFNWCLWFQLVLLVSTGVLVSTDPTLVPAFLGVCAGLSLDVACSTDMYSRADASRLRN